MNQFPNASIASFVHCPLQHGPDGCGKGYGAVFSKCIEEGENKDKFIFYKPLEQNSEGGFEPIDSEKTISEMTNICSSCELRHLHNTETRMMNVLVKTTGQTVTTCATLIKNS